MATLREKYPLENRKPLKKTISRSILFVIFVLFLGMPLILFIRGVSGSISGVALGSILLSNLWILLTIIVAGIILMYIYEVFYMKYYFYDLVGKNLGIKKGVFSRSEITLPINRLQDVYVDQDVLDRIFGLYDVHVSSATFISGWLSHIDGLSKENSEIVKNLLLAGIHKENE